MVAVAPFDGEPPSVFTFEDLSLNNEDQYYGVAAWCDAYGNCNSITSPRTTVDTVAPTMDAYYGSALSPEAPPVAGSDGSSSGSAAVADSSNYTVGFQSCDGAYFTITQAFDSISGLASVQVAVEEVGSGSDAVCAARCGAQSEPNATVVAALSFNPVTVGNPGPGTPGTTSRPLPFHLPLTTTQNTYYRVILQGLDAAGNGVQVVTPCVLIDKTPPSVDFSGFGSGQVVDAGGVPNLLAAGRTLTITATVQNDVAGVAAVGMYCGTSPLRRDVPVSAVVTAPLIPPCSSSAPATCALPSLVTVSGTVVVPSDNNTLDGSDICCTVTGAWPMDGYVPASGGAPCVHLDFSPPLPGVVHDGASLSDGCPGCTTYFGGGFLYGQWLGFSEAAGGSIASYWVGASNQSLNAFPYPPVPAPTPSFVPWQNVGLRQSVAIPNITDLTGAVEGQSFYVWVMAQDAVGHVSLPVSGGGQIFDPTVPNVTTAGSYVSMVSSDFSSRRYVGPGQALLCFCPIPFGLPSGIASVVFSVRVEAPGSPSGSARTVYSLQLAQVANSELVVQLDEPYIQGANYSGSCVYTSGAGKTLTLRTADPPMLADLTGPLCTFQVPANTTSSTSQPLNVSWSCTDPDSGLAAPLLWSLGTPGAGDAFPRQAAPAPALAESGSLALVLPAGWGQWVPGTTYFLTLGVTNGAGSIAWVTSPGVTVEPASPLSIVDVVVEEGAAAPGSSSWFVGPPGASQLLTVSWVTLGSDAALPTAQVCINDAAGTWAQCTNVTASPGVSSTQLAWDGATTDVTLLQAVVNPDPLGVLGTPVSATSPSYTVAWDVPASFLH